MNKAAIICLLLYKSFGEYIFSFLLGKYVGKELLGHRTDERLTLTKLPNTSSKWLCPVTLSSAVKENYICSHSG